MGFQQSEGKNGKIRSFADSAVLIAALFFASAMPTEAEEYEQPQPIEPARIHGRKAFGPNYQLQNPVRGDGFLRFYKLSTFYGSIKVIGDGLLKVRFRELAALQLLDELKLDSGFTRKFDRAIESSLSFSREATNQRRAQSQSITSGVDVMFQEIAEGARDAENTDENKAGSSSDISRAKRQIAYQLNVDPYTDFKPLAKRLNQMSRAGEKGASLIAAALTALNTESPSTSTTTLQPTALQMFIRDNTPSQLKVHNRKILIDMDIDEGTVDAFLSNVHYTISDQTALSIDLNRLKSVSSRHIFLSQAAIARHREVAYFHKTTAELFADYHEHKAPLKKFISAAEFPFAQTLSGKLIGLFAVDELVWTPVVADAVRSINSAIVAQKLSGSIDLHITGTATSMALSNLQRLKWNVFTQAKFR